MYFEAANWLRLALSFDPNQADANFILGVMAEQGLAVDVDHEHAFKYYEKAANAGNWKAFTKLGHLFFQGVKKSQFLDLASGSP